MLSGVTLRAQIASVIDALSKAAAAEIAKVVEDGMVVLRLEVCQRENEIQKLKRNIQLLHGELRAVQQLAEIHGPILRYPGRDELPACVGAERNLDLSRSPLPVSEVQVKVEPVENRVEDASGGHPDKHKPMPTLYKNNQWRSTRSDAEHPHSDYLHSGQNSLPLPEFSSSCGELTTSGGGSDGLQRGLLGRGLLGYSQFHNANNAMRQRTAKKLLFKKGYFCPYCGKYFERAGHLERHKRIHTGEKPYGCEVCGRRFNQKCSVKEHMKTHRRCLPPAPTDVPAGDQPLPEVNPGGGGEAPCPETENPTTADEEKHIPTSLQPKLELEVKNGIQSVFVGEKPDNLSHSFGRDAHQWTPPTQNPPELNPPDLTCSSAGNITTFSENYPLHRAALDQSGAAFSFPENVNASAIPPSAHQSSDSFLGSREAGFPAAGESSAKDYQHVIMGSSLSLKPKRSFSCSYCSKVFERSGHLERHLRIHTGEKPYGCHICGRFFNQKSSLKGHMKTHKDGDSCDLLESHPLMFPVAEEGELRNGLTAPDDELPGGVTAAKEPVTVKEEPEEEQLQTGAPLGGDSDDGGGLERSKPWPSNVSPSEQTVCVLLHDANAKDKETPGNNQYLVMGFGPRRPDSTPTYEPPHQPSLHRNAFSAVSEGTPNGGEFEYKMDFSSNNEEEEHRTMAAPQNTFICASCGQSFENFASFQGHQCDKVTEQL